MTVDGENSRQRIAPSILNDVLGPVMRGPSSSHVAAAARIGRLTRCMAGPWTEEIVVSFGANSSLVYTYHTHRSDMGFAAGLMNLPLDDPRVVNAMEEAQKIFRIGFSITDEKDDHPSLYTVQLMGKDRWIDFKAASTGGGMIEVREVKGVPVSLWGDRHELLFFSDDRERLRPIQDLAVHNEDLKHSLYEKEGRFLLRISAMESFGQDFLSQARGVSPDEEWLRLEPVLPVITPFALTLPFQSYGELTELLAGQGRPLWQAALDYECARGRASEEQVMDQLRHLLKVMERSVKNGLEPWEYPDRILPSQAYKMKGKNAEKKLYPDPLLNQMIPAITAVMESKSALFPIVAAPTAGSCGCLPGTLLGLGLWSEEELVHGLLVAGLVGLLFSMATTFAAEERGCQVECGAASGMTAAALAHLKGGTAQEALDAAAMALQNLSGLACDPIAGGVEVPCLGKNIVAGANALCCANMALAGFDCVVPLDETIKAIDQIGSEMPSSLRCTLGGLGCTPTARRISEELGQNRKDS